MGLEGAFEPFDTPIPHESRQMNAGGGRRSAAVKQRFRRAVVSELPEPGEGGWEVVPPGSFCVFDGDSVEGRAFRPGAVAQAV
jgi:hypothetical protein